MPTTTEPAPNEAPPAPKRPAHRVIGGLLPFIGAILFVLVTIEQFAGGAGEDWGPALVSNAVQYLIGWSMLIGGLAHLFFGKRISATIGFTADRYEFEVGAADVAFGATALISVWFAPEFAWPIILASSIFRVIAGIGHIRSMVRDRNFAPNNTLILIIDFLVPAFLVTAYLLWA